MSFSPKKSIEELLGQSTSLLIETLDNFRDGIFALDNNWNFTYLNKRAASIAGLEPRDIVGTNLWNDFPQVKGTVLEEYYLLAMQGQEIRHFEAIGPGTEIWFEVTVYPSKEGIIVHWHDITERKKTEEALKKSKADLEQRVAQRTAELSMERERFFNMLEDLPVMVCLITADYKIPFANRLFREKFGEAKDRCCYEYIGCVNAPCVDCQSLVPLQTGKPHHWTANFPDGTVVDAHDFPFTDIDGTKMILEADVDITERVNLQKQLQEKERLAAIGQTAGMVGHDIRNPLQAMTIDIYLMKDEIASGCVCKNKEDLMESLVSLDENISYINKIVQDLQDYARPITPEYSVVDLSSVLVRIFETVRVPESVKLSIKVNDLEKLRIDPMLLQRALSNLVTNAIQAMPKGGVLEITGYPRENKAVITISDTGVGIPDQIKPKLFSPMMTTKSKGQGFGLAVSKRIVQALKGTIDFESEKAKGTKFIIELPTRN